MTTLSRSQLQAHAHAWISAWNRADVDAVLATFAEDAEFTSALALPYAGTSRVRGKAALRRYWEAALADRPGLRFELVAAICDETAQVLVVHYVALQGGRRTRACEIMQFQDGVQVRGEALYGAPDSA